MTAIKLVTFDVTGTLLFFRTPIFDKYIEAASKFGIKGDPKVIGKNFKESWTKLNVEHPNFGKRTGLGWQNWWERYVQETFAGYFKPEDNKKIKGLMEDLIGFHSTKDAFIIRPGTIELLTYLKTRSLNLGIISNYDPRLHGILDLMDLKKYFDFVLISYEFGHPKPDRRIFHEALRLGSCKSGLEAVHVGDDLELDYLGAKDAGLRAVLIKSKEENLNNDKVDKSEVFPDFFQLKTYLETLK